MSITLADLVYTLAAPALAALLLAWLLARLLPAEAASRWRLAAATAVSFVAGYVLLPEWAPLWPDRHWQWLPALAVAAAILGAVSAGPQIGIGERWLTAAALAAVAALAIVPTWDTLEPPRTTLVPLVAGYLFLLYALLDALPGRLQGRTFTALLALAALGTTSLVAYEVSAKVGQLGATLAAALFGAAAYGLLIRNRTESETAGQFDPNPSLSNRTLALVYAIAVGGLGFVATIEPTTPAWPLLVAPAAPLVVALFAIPPLTRLPNASAAALQAIAVLLVLIAVAAWLLLRAEVSSDEWSALLLTARP